MTTGAVGIECGDRRATLTLERPPWNILDLATIAELGDRLGKLEDDARLQVLVVQGAGGKAFSTGVAVEDHTPEKIDAMLDGFHGVLRRLCRLPAISVARIEGHCLGGGMELAAACDIVIAAEDSTFGQPEIRLGCFPPAAAALYGGRLGHGRAVELLASGATIDAGRALEIGFVDHLAPAAALDRRLEEVIAPILEQSAAATRLTKRALATARNDAFFRALAETDRLYREELAATEDLAEGIAAFVEKRTPVWKHR